MQIRAVRSTYRQFTYSSGVRLTSEVSLFVEFGKVRYVLHSSTCCEIKTATYTEHGFEELLSLVTYEHEKGGIPDEINKSFTKPSL